MKVTHSFNDKPCVMFHNEFSFSFFEAKPYIAFNNLIGKLHKFGILTDVTKLVKKVWNFKFIILLSHILKPLNFLSSLKFLHNTQNDLDTLCKTDNLLTFDDAIYQQIEVIKYCEKTSSAKIFVFPSGHLVREHNYIKLESNEVAHSNYHVDFKPPYPSTFMSSTEVWDLLDTNVKIGIHGWYHLYIGEDKDNHSGNLRNALKILYPKLEYNIVSIIKLLKDDARKSIEWYTNNLEKNNNYKYYIEDNKIVLYYCTPYNVRSQYQDIYIEFLKEYLKKDKFLLSLNHDIHLEVFSNGRKEPKNLV